LRQHALVSFSLAFAIGCGGGGGGGGDGDGDGDGDDDGPDAGEQPGGAVEAFPVGFAVASPLQAAGGGGGVAPARARGGSAGIGQSVQALTNVVPGKSFAQKQEELAAILAGASAEDCALVLGNLAGGYSPLCYGPSLEYHNHPDSPGGNQDGQLPSGDLGLWQETDGPVEPCAAAKLGSLVGNAGDKIDYGLYMAASMVCLMNVEGIALPAEGSSEDVTALLDESLAANNPGVEVGAAAVARLPDAAGGEAVYEYSVELDVSPDGVHAFHVGTVLEHAFDAASADSYRGTVRGAISGFDDFMPVQAFSVTYAHSADALRYRLLLAAYGADPPVVFDEDGLLAVDGDWQGNFQQGVFDLDAETGSVGDVSFAWQAGRGDDRARVFNVFVGEEEGARAGCGFFGFGPRFDAEAGTVSDNTISTFICNWAGPGGDHTGVPGAAQKQCFAGEPGGPFSVTESRIAYAPVSDCDTTGDPDFEWKTVDESEWHGEAIAVDLIDLAGDPDYASYTPPAPPGS
jgi:hypothetical protein